MDRQQRPEPSPALPAGAEALAVALSARTHMLRLRTAVDFTLIDALLRMGRPAAAVRALEGHGEALRAFAADVQGLLEEATAARAPTAAQPPEADVLGDGDRSPFRRRRARGLRRTSQAAPAPAQVADASAQPPAAPMRTLSQSRLRRSLATSAATAAIVAGLVSPGARRPVPPATAGLRDHTPADVSLAAARGRLYELRAAASPPEALAAAIRQVHDDILELPDPVLEHRDVQVELDALFAVEQRTLNGLLPLFPGARALLLEVRALRAAVGLPPHLELVATGPAAAANGASGAPASPDPRSLPRI